MGTLHEDQYTFMDMPRSLIKKKVVEKTKIHILR